MLGLFHCFDSKRVTHRKLTCLIWCKIAIMFRIRRANRMHLEGIDSVWLLTVAQDYLNKFLLVHHKIWSWRNLWWLRWHAWYRGPILVLHQLLPFLLLPRLQASFVLYQVLNCRLVRLLFHGWYLHWRLLFNKVKKLLRRLRPHDFSLILS